jgi:hypothetical protein
MARPFALLLGLSLAAACQRAPSEPPGRDREQPVGSSNTPADRAPAAPALNAAAGGAFRLPAAERLVAIGDLHGDLASTRQALRLAGAIDENDRWVGKDLTVVQTGDQLDRGDDEPEILALLERLASEARKAGGRVIVLNGNHELMNVAGDLRYVTEEGFTDYAPSGGADKKARASAFAPGSPLAAKLAQRPVIIAVGDTLFAHAGVLPLHVSYGIDRINDETSRWIRGEAALQPRVVTEENAPVWTRLYGSEPPPPDACATLTKVLDSLSLSRLVVGHTIQKGGINGACGDKLFRIDVGLSDYYGQTPTQVLEIQGGKTKILTQQ